MSAPAKQPKPETVQLVEDDGPKVGDPIEVDPAAGFVRLPDGTVVSTRGTYTPRHAGEHVFYVVQSGHLVEAKRVTVA